MKFLIKKLIAGGAKRLEILTRVGTLVAEGTEGRAVVIVGSGLRNDGHHFLVAETIFGIVAIAVYEEFVNSVNREMIGAADTLPSVVFAAVNGYQAAATVAGRSCE